MNQRRVRNLIAEDRHREPLCQQGFLRHAGALTPLCHAPLGSNIQNSRTLVARAGPRKLLDQLFRCVMKGRGFACASRFGSLVPRGFVERNMQYAATKG